MKLSMLRRLLWISAKISDYIVAMKVNKKSTQCVENVLSRTAKSYNAVVFEIDNHYHYNCDND